MDMEKVYDAKKIILKEFLHDETSILEAKEAILSFIKNENLRNGEYEGNSYVLKKMDPVNFIIYLEYVYPDKEQDTMSRSIMRCASFYRDELIEAIEKA